MVKIYNSLTGQVEEFRPINKNEVKMYVCGPTVYNDSHIGNSRPVVFFDVVSRFFSYLGYNVKYVTNFTDIDDKIIARAQEEGRTEEDVAKQYIQAFIDLAKRLNCLPFYKTPQVTEHIPQIVDFIGGLVEKGFAYQSGGDVYFSVGEIDDYGILSGQSIDKLLTGFNLEHNDLKKSPVDFNLWKETNFGKRWSSPWSDGRPGWHTECVVMIDEIFGGKIDIHGGGVDLKFPHHDNEIAQSIAAHNHLIANYWMHNGRMDLSDVKMSKSLGNVIWTKDLLDQYPYQAYRLLLLNVPYRQPLNYTEELMQQALTEYERIKRSYIGLFRKIELEYVQTDFHVKIVDEALLDLKANFIREMKNDFNTANALTVILEVVKKVNQVTRQSTDVALLKQTLSLLDELLEVIGIKVDVDYLTTDEKALIAKWQELRKKREFEEADILRQEILDRGIEL